MLKNFLNLILLCSVLNFLFSCSNNRNKTNEELESIAIVYSDTLKNASSINEFYGLKKEADKYSNIIVQTSNFNYGINEFIIDKDLNQVYFKNDTLNSLNISNNKITNLKFSNCTINNITISSSEINNLSINNSKINNIEIISSPFNLININSLSNDTIRKVIIKNCYNSKNISLSGNFKEIVLDGGSIKNLDITRINTLNTDLQILGSRLITPNFYSSLSKNIDVLNNSMITSSSVSDKLILFEEKKLASINSWSSYKTKRIEQFNRFRFLEQSYGILSLKFIKLNDKPLSNYFSYKQKQIHSLLKHGYIKNKLNVIWNEFFRGNYGTSIGPILFTFICFIFIFTVVYIILGHFNYIFFYLKLTDDDGKPKPKRHFITKTKSIKNILEYSYHCIWFSLSQMVAGSIISSLNFGKFTIKYLTPPRTYYPIGIGVFFSILQNIIGIILVFNFISTFINISLK